jgi:2'-5' RNA ligase
MFCQLKGGYFMYEYVFVGYLDHETEVNFRRLWKDLSEQNISHYGVETKGKRPHITIADYDALDKNRFIQLADRFYEDKEKVDLTLNTLGIFIGTGTLFTAPTLSTELLDFHSSHHDYFRTFNQNETSFYLPSKWSPHCTIASRLDEDKMVQAFSYCKKNIDQIHGTLSGIALIELKLNNDGVVIEDTVIFSKELK